MIKALVCGAGGFIGSHLVRRLKNEGCWVRGADLKYPEFSKTAADEFLLLDLREEKNCRAAVRLEKSETFDEVYQLAADMGGMGFIHSAECEIMRNSALINIHMVDSAANAAVKRYFFSSSACVYRDMKPDEPELSEEEAYPALPDNEYGWEKLYTERLVMADGTAWPRGSPAFKIVMALKEPGRGEGKRLRPPCAGRSPRQKTGVRSRSGEKERPCGPIPTSTT